MKKLFFRSICFYLCSDKYSMFFFCLNSFAVYLVSGQTNAWNTHWLKIGSFAILRCFKIYCKLVFGRFLKFLGKHHEWNHLKTKYYRIKCRDLKIFKSFRQFKMQPVINNSHCFAWQKELWPNIAIHFSRFAQNSYLYQYHIWCINSIRCIISVHDGVPLQRFVWSHQMKILKYSRFIYFWSKCTHSVNVRISLKHV